ncbi:MAG TPA: hypothetical protein DCY48_04575 [Candidatus Magasanikbacteria bacterium]|uniref:Uncharacterized protein n=1 Tax=Candidatus Magasanikbacteria bacterium GW2011_GWA2_46_17 TaxID=1619042 RepID=A0A0G1P1L3_9BACT|nr:MAG: hypothetical protein UX39_C0006G0006 [Candidatus Magasanikbacteria bacterium GW2011_GWA2_46_17]OGH77695.1 MAG: hypothetical protein A3I74_02975 [Candidatus Magasanikbacteria bacterium RIFCSPLOWO2_02_FULL_47_16]OGH79546.1 MAG: hypothetical protein A3C10_00430 [Candidatus Magasanikbacteria bacterium RIFCSPHIGHO2_02_FULL_48_18]OGH83411.1 MAG: hypothetical protein A3G08_01095 [Candidatus Magasanikbacteria bacterium RIFCSPLOWO2_12_FULL_47_9b]HAZ29016.1 hypothetical protein [Candidatus Magasa
MKKKLLQTFFLFSLVFFVCFVFAKTPANAANLKKDVMSQIGAVVTDNEGTVIQAQDPRIVVAGIIEVILGLMGTIFITLIVAAGYWRLTAQGEESRIEKSTKTMQAAVIGLAVVLLGYSITRFVVLKVYEAIKYQKPTVEEPEKGWFDKYIF